MTIGELKTFIANMRDDAEFLIELDEEFLHITATRGSDESNFVVTVE